MDYRRKSDLFFCRYEIKNKPVFASMKRARTELAKPHVSAVCVECFFEYLVNKYPECKDNIEHIVFYDFDFQKKGKASEHYNIAWIYTKPDLKFRDEFFEERSSITQNTGWYPYITGSYADFNYLSLDKGYSLWNIKKHKIPYVHLGKPIEISNVAKDYSATAILMKCENGNILLDTGFGIDECIIDVIDFIFVSHLHYDHTGGLFSILKMKDIPVLMSSLTLNYLLNLSSVEIDDKKKLLKNVVLCDNLNSRSYIVNTIEFFDTYHAPGAKGLIYKYRGDMFIYPGDMCLENGFFDFTSNIENIISSCKGTTRLLVDCALLKKSDNRVGNESIHDIMEKISKGIHSCVFISSGTEMLFSIYIMLFKMTITMDPTVKFVVSDELFHLLKGTLRTWYLPEYSMDPYISHVLGISHDNFAESRRLFPYSESDQFLKSENVIYILTVNDILSGINLTIANSDICYVTGPVALSKNTLDKISESGFKQVCPLASPDWSFHSSKEDISRFILNHSNVEMYLFHTFPKTIKKYIKEISADKNLCLSAISNEAIRL